MNSFYWLLAEKALCKWLPAFPKNVPQTASSATLAVHCFRLTSPGSDSLLPRMMYLENGQK